MSGEIFTQGDWIDRMIWKPKTTKSEEQKSLAEQEELYKKKQRTKILLFVFDYIENNNFFLKRTNLDYNNITNYISFLSYVQ